MTGNHEAGNKDVLFYVSIFRVEPYDLAQPLRGSCGFLGWHAEVVHENQDGLLTTYIVLYQSSGATSDDMWQRLEEKKQSAIDLVYTLLLPITLQAEQHLVAKLVGTFFLNYEGKDQGGALDIVRRIGSLGTNRYMSGSEYPFLQESPRLKRALQYYNAGLYVAQLGLYTDACMNYIRALEALLGKYRGDRRLDHAYRIACERVGVNFDDVKPLMTKIRNDWAIAHVRDEPDRPPTLKEPPEPSTMSQCHEICRKFLLHYWHTEKSEFEHSGKGNNYWPLYSGFAYGREDMVVPTLWADKNLGFGSPHLPVPAAVIGILNQHRTNPTNSS